MQNSNLDRILQSVIVLGTVALIIVVAVSLRNRVVGVGDTAPEFSIRTDSGLTVSTGNFGGKVLILNFWATWCPPCIDEIPSLNSLQEKMKNEGVVVLGVSVDEDPAAYSKFLETHGISFLTARDPEAGISASYGTFRYPETYIISSEGKVMQKIVGPTVWTNEQMISYIRSLL